MNVIWRGASVGNALLFNFYGGGAQAPWAPPPGHAPGV